MYITLETDMTDLSVSQAEAPGELPVSITAMRNAVIWSDALDKKSAYPGDSVEPSPGSSLLFQTGVMLFVREAEAEPASQPALWTSGGISNEEQSCSSSGFPGTHWWSTHHCSEIEMWISAHLSCQKSYP